MKLINILMDLSMVRIVMIQTCATQVVLFLLRRPIVYTEASHWSVSTLSPHLWQ